MTAYLSPAKVNLSLGITGKDPKDGYHYIDSIFDPVSVFDVIEIEKSSGQSINLNSRLDIPKEKNLVYKAAALFKEAYGIKKGVNISLHKNIPQGAGLGGGSSNAAAVLHAMNDIFKVKAPLKELSALGFKLGSDVPFFIFNRTARVTGKGEKITPVERKRVLWYVLLCKNVHVATKKAYELLDNEKKLTFDKSYNILLLRYLKGQDVKGGFLQNDFEKPIFRSFPGLKEVKIVLKKQKNCIDACMSGSGATVFALFETKEDADSSCRRMKAVFPGSFVRTAHSI